MCVCVCVCIDLFNPYSNPKKRCFDYSHFTDEETEEQRREVACPSCRAAVGGFRYSEFGPGQLPPVHILATMLNC